MKNVKNNIYLDKPPTNEEGVYIAFKKISEGEKFGLSSYLPVARILLNPTLKIDFYPVPTLSEEEKNFIKTESNNLIA